MEIRAVANDMPIEAGQRRFVVNLFVKEGETAQVRSCEVQGDKFRNRTSFTGVCGLNDVFEEKVAEGLRQCMQKLSVETKVLSLPDYVIETRGLILAGAHMMSTYSMDGTIAVILRFKLMIGSVANAFVPALEIDPSTQDEQARLGTLVLSDISMPLLNLCSSMESGLTPDSFDTNALHRRLAERAHEIRFQIELVKRYVDGLERFSQDQPRGTPEWGRPSDAPAALYPPRREASG
ncbi:hypothetical protein [Sulfitobacter sp. S190]|uniref:hypothetical protein n=1 Tax=Sulfitobacter sp. S190 TaxID=2867022 RepID=UPI0021A3EB4B|nr:hypothetical protein [Sulfitobacter sp. S190]UWR22660.1 hypothetical protein K3756_01290 [Sulfitobacter sp. S190]